MVTKKLTLNCLAYKLGFFIYFNCGTRLFRGTTIFINMEKKKYKRPQIEVKCDNPTCGKKFNKDGSEVRRNKKRGSGNYCSISCSSKINIKKLLGNDKHGDGKNIGYSKADKYTGLREHYRRAKYRNKEFNLTLDDLLVQWNKQKGKCPYTGINLIHPIRLKDEGLIYMASLDRIDSTKGYVKGNVQFISAAANLAKNNMTDDEMMTFCELICNNWNRK